MFGKVKCEAASTRPNVNIHPHILPASALDTRTYDVIVIGGGPAGETTAARVARDSLTVLIIESELVGGECPYWACVPSKAFLRASEVLEGAKAVGGAKQRLDLLTQKYGVPAKPELDLKGAWARRDMVAHGWKDDFQLEYMHGILVDVAHGFGRVIGERKVEIKDWHSGEVVEVKAKQAVVILTGTTPVIPDIQGLNESRYWTAREAVSAREVPEHLIALGAGAVGTEMATLYNQLGSKPTLITNAVLPKMVSEVGKMVQERLAKLGVAFRLEMMVAKVERTGKTIAATVSDGFVVEGTELLIATDRKARTTGMTLNTVGGASDGAWIGVDDSMCVSSLSEGWLYAVGDPNGQALMTHFAKYQAKLAEASIVAKFKGSYKAGIAAQDWDKLTAKPKGLAIVQAILADPQVAASGLTHEQATARMAAYFSSWWLRRPHAY